MNIIRNQGASESIRNLSLLRAKYMQKYIAPRAQRRCTCWKLCVAASIDVFRNSGVGEEKGCWRIQQAPRVRKKQKKAKNGMKEESYPIVFVQYHILNISSSSHRICNIYCGFPLTRDGLLEHKKVTRSMFLKANWKIALKHYLLESRIFHYYYFF